jgi:biopolymer transport protein ExbD
MASIEGGGDDGHKKGPGVKKAKKLSTRVDMTPMVDLGFLLITFFIFTATMTTPSTMNLNMPKDVDKPEDESKIKQSGALTIMIGKENQLYYYEGELDPKGENFKQIGFVGIRDVIINKKKSVIASYQGNAECEQKKRSKGEPVEDCREEDFMVVIKPTVDATYKNTVDILDEMTINDVKRFALVKIADTEKMLIKLTEDAGGIK